MSDRLIRGARERGRELWTCECWSMAQLPEMARYFGGFWSYRCGVKGNGDGVYISTARGRGGATLFPRLNEKDEYVDTDNWVFGYVLPGPDGPIDTLGLELRREGIDDFRYYELLDRLLKEKSHSRNSNTRAAITRARAIREAVLRRFRHDAFSDMAGGYVWIHDYRPQPELRLSDYDRLRRSLAEACVTLSQNKKGSR